MPTIALILLSCEVAPVRAADNGYLDLAIGTASADFSGSSAGSSEFTARFAGARQMNARLALEFGVSFARGFAPPPDVLASHPGTHVKVTALDISAVFDLPMTRTMALFVGVGPALAATRLEESATRGRATKIQSSLTFTPRLTAGLDIARSEHTAVRLSLDRLGTVGSSSGNPRTGRASVNSVSLGVLIRF